jgi:hypothetical protein
MNLSLFKNGINLMPQHLYLSEIAKRTSGNPQITKQWAPETPTTSRLRSSRLGHKSTRSAINQHHKKLTKQSNYKKAQQQNEPSPPTRSSAAIQNNLKLNNMPKLASSNNTNKISQQGQRPHRTSQQQQYLEHHKYKVYQLLKN